MIKLFSFKIVLSLFFIALCQSTWAQTATLNLSSGTATRGASVSLNLNLTATGALMPAAAQWTLSYSTIDISSISVNAGPAAANVVCSLIFVGRTVPIAALRASETAWLARKSSTIQITSFHPTTRIRAPAAR
jgi:hypothetical protein